MSDATPVTLNVTSTDSYTIETTEADIRAACDRQGIKQEGIDLDTLLSGADGFPWELVLAALANGVDTDGETWTLDDWTSNEADDDE